MLAIASRRERSTYYLLVYARTLCAGGVRNGNTHWNGYIALTAKSGGDGSYVVDHDISAAVHSDAGRAGLTMGEWFAARRRLTPIMSIVATFLTDVQILACG